MPLHLVMPDILADDITDELLKIIYRLHRFISADADDDSIVMVESPYGIETESILLTRDVLTRMWITKSFRKLK